MNNIKSNIPAHIIDQKIKDGYPTDFLGISSSLIYRNALASDFRMHIDSSLGRLRRAVITGIDKE